MERRSRNVESPELFGKVIDTFVPFLFKNVIFVCVSVQ